jgi:hypothetical protein
MNDTDDDLDMDKFAYLGEDLDMSELGRGKSSHHGATGIAGRTYKWAKEALVQLNEKEAEVAHHTDCLHKLIDGLLAAATLGDERATLLRTSVEAAADASSFTLEELSFEADATEQRDDVLLVHAGRCFLSQMSDMRQEGSMKAGINADAERLVSMSFEVRALAALCRSSDVSRTLLSDADAAPRFSLSTCTN